MQKHSTNEKYDSPYLLDKNHQLADAFGASTTPVFLMNNTMNLVYKGAIDDNCGSKKEVKEEWLKDALESLGKGEKIKIQKLEIQDVASKELNKHNYATTFCEIICDACIANS